MSLRLRDGRTISVEKRDYEGFTTNPAVWETVLRKFQALTGPHTTSSMRERIAAAVDNLERIEIRKLTDLLRQITPGPVDREEGVLLYGL